MENLAYPKILKTKEDIEFVVKNFPREVWYEDIKELYSLARGYYVVGRDPIYKVIELEGGTRHLIFAGCVDIDDKERADVTEHDECWEKAYQPLEDLESADFYYHGRHYYAEFRVLKDSVVGKAGVDIDWLEGLLFGDDKYDAVIEELNDMQRELQAMEDEDKERDGNQVMKDGVCS